MPGITILYIFLCAAHLIVTNPCMATDTADRIIFRHFTSSDGLGSNSIASICVDKSGCIWAGTSDGIYRYCGDRFERIPSPAGGAFRIADVNYMIIDESDDLWIAANTGLFVYSIREEKFRQIRLIDSEGIRISSSINTIAKDMDGNKWFSTYGDGVLKYDSKTETMKRFAFEGTKNYVDKVFTDSDNTVWAAVREKGKRLARLNKASGRFENVSLRYDDPGGDDDIITIYEDSRGRLWLGTWLKGVQEFDKHSGFVKTYLNPSGKQIMHIHSLAEYKPGKLFIGSDEGIILFDILSGKTEYHIPDQGDPGSISDKFVYPITRDHEGGFWIGTYYGGINYVSPYNDLFYGNNCSQFTGSKSGSIVSSIRESDNGDIWIGTDDNGLVRYTPSDGRYRQFMPIPGQNSISYHNVHALCFDGEDLWIGTYTGGLNIYNTRTGIFRVYSGDRSGGLGNSSIYSIFKDSSSTIWIGTMGGIDVYDRGNDSFKEVRSIGGTVIDICQDRSGYIWFATNVSGLQRYNPLKDEWKEYLPSRSGGFLPEMIVNTLFIDENDVLWAGTSGGLFRYNPVSDRFDYIHMRDEDDHLCCIKGDNNILWISTTNGMLRFDPVSGSCTAYGQPDGLQSDHFIAASGYKTMDGRIFFGSVNGFNSFLPHRIIPDKNIPDLVLTGLLVNNEIVRVAEQSILQHAINHQDRIELGPDQNNIVISYSAISYFAPEKISYSYRLEGYDEAWNYVSNNRSATYTNLSPGTYEFQVRSSNGNGQWATQYKAIQIYVRPPLIFSPVFIILYIVTGILLLIWLFVLLVRRSEKKSIHKMELLHQQREKEIYDEKIRFFTIIAHEIRTPLSLITAPVERILMMPENQIANIRDDLNTIDRNSHRLLSLVNQLLDFRKIEQDQDITLYFTRTSMPNLIKSIADTYMPYMIQANVEVSISDIEEFEAEVDHEAITKILSNLLTNAAKHARSRVELKCVPNNKEQNFSMSVTDDGCGIPQSEMENIFKPFYRLSENTLGTGIGLSIVKSIVSLHNGTVTLESMPGQGSTFTVTLPLRQPEKNEGDSPGKVPEDILADDPVRTCPDGRCSLLIVEDNLEMMVFLYDILTSDYNVLTARNGAEALEIMKTNSVSILVCDWMMPVMDGIELCKAIRGNLYLSHIPFVMLTAKTDMKAKVEGMEAGVDIFIEKPFSVKYLCACIRNLLDIRKTMIEKFSRMPLVPLIGVAPNPSNEQFLSQISDIIEENISNSELSVDFIVRQMYISRSGFFAKIKTLVDVTPNELIQIIRLKKAAALMLENRYLVSEVCYMVGFRNPSYFSKCFQKQFRVTPVEFIKSHVKTTDESKPLTKIRPDGSLS
jgi:signal transduction histidine kinase/ligand-binding sensor domain-containing protein/DNA-binding response OmpR family regulator